METIHEHPNTTLQLRGFISQVYAIALDKKLNNMTFQEIQVLRDTKIWKEPTMMLGVYVLNEITKSLQVKNEAT